MSVINKMLRDLDQRQVVEAPLSAGPDSAPHTPLRRGTSSVAQSVGGLGPASRHWVWMGLLGVVVAALAGGWQWMRLGQEGLQSDMALASASVTPPSPGVPAAVSAPALAMQPAAPAPSIVVDAAVNPGGDSVPGAMVLRMEESLSARRALDALLSTTAPVAPSTVIAPAAAPASAVVPERSRARVLASASLAASAPAAPTTRAPVATVQADAMPVIQRQQQAGSDALAQAQSLWNTGSRDAAIELMQQTIVAAERSAKAGSGGSANPVLVPLVREMARMQLAEGRFGAVWELLTRLELQLGNQPDLWAIRANAAQRLGRHQDSVHAYMVALQSRPDEQRWLLGTAVSLAALGQITSAAEMAEKARRVGPVAKEIVAYLRQSGVTLRD